MKTKWKELGFTSEKQFNELCNAFLVKNVKGRTQLVAERIQQLLDMDVKVIEKEEVVLRKGKPCKNDMVCEEALSVYNDLIELERDIKEDQKLAQSEKGEK